MFRIAIMGGIIIINFVLQTSILPHMAIFGVIPDTALILIVCYGILRGDVEGAIFGFCTGLVQDVFFGTAIGLFALIGFLVGYVSGKPFKDFFKDNYFLPFFIVLGAVLVQQLFIYITSYMFFGQLNIWLFTRMIILPTTIYTVTLSIPLYILLHYINGKIERRANGGRNLFEGENDT